MLVHVSIFVRPLIKYYQQIKKIEKNLLLDEFDLFHLTYSSSSLFILSFYMYIVISSISDPDQ